MDKLRTVTKAGSTDSLCRHHQQILLQLEDGSLGDYEKIALPTSCCNLLYLKLSSAEHPAFKA